MPSKQATSAPAQNELSNQDILVYALYRLDGAGRFVDVEEVIQECWRLSPSRFGWRTLRYPSDRTGWAAVGHIEAARPELMLKTANGLGRQLTAAGVEWVRARLADFEHLASEETRAPKTRRPSFKLLAELAKHPWTKAFFSGERRELIKIDAAELLRCAPDSPRSVWRQRIATLRSAATDNERLDVLGLLDEMEHNHAEWFSED